MTGKEALEEGFLSAEECDLADKIAKLLDCESWELTEEETILFYCPDIFERAFGDMAESFTTCNFDIYIDRLEEVYQAIKESDGLVFKKGKKR